MLNDDAILNWLNTLILFLVVLVRYRVHELDVRLPSVY